MKELTYCEKDDKHADKIRELTGDYNDFPPGWRELTEEEFAKSEFFSYEPRYRESRQMIGERGQKMTPAILFHMHRAGEGFGLVNDFWAGKVRFFAFGCQHKWKELSSEEAREEGIQHFGMCWHVHKCQKCGAIESHDSSD